MTEGEKLEIFNAILSLGDIWGVMDKVEVLDSIWKLNLMASEDPRYKDRMGMPSSIYVTTMIGMTNMCS